MRKLLGGENSFEESQQDVSSLAILSSTLLLTKDFLNAL